MDHAIPSGKKFFSGKRDADFLEKTGFQHGGVGFQFSEKRNSALAQEIVQDARVRGGDGVCGANAVV
ncbi:hypothetical protein F8S12_12920 [Nostoc sp. WHI]|nr:hypothetical protein [Nostoc sp. WHI]